MDKLTPQYVAGFLDGEGCFSVHVNRAYNAQNANRQPRVVMHVVVVNTHKGIIKKLQAQYGGSFYEQNVAYNPNARQSYRLVISEQAGCRLLEEILPFLVVKKQQAKILLALGVRKKKNGQKRLSLRESAYRKRLADKCRVLNRKGPR